MVIFREKMISNYAVKVSQSKAKKSLSKKSNLVESLESLTWFDKEEIDDSTLANVNDLISLIRDLHRSLKRQYDSLFLISPSFKNEKEFEAFEESLEDLLEISNDLESVFFGLPAIQEFNEVSKSFENLG